MFLDDLNEIGSLDLQEISFALTLCHFYSKA